MTEDIFAQMERDAPKFRRAPTAEESQKLTDLGKELVSIDERLEKYKKVAADLMVRKTVIQMQEMVDLMDLIGQDRMGLPDQSVDLVLEDYFKAGLPKPDEKESPEEQERKAALREEGLRFLREDAGDLINTTITITLPKGSLEKAKEIVGFLTSDQGMGLDPAKVALEEGVHWATLTSWLKEQVRGQKRPQEELPLEALGATIGRIVKIVKRKAKK